MNNFLIPFTGDKILLKFTNKILTYFVSWLCISVLLRDNVPAPESAAVRAEGGDDLRVPRLDRGDKGREVSERKCQGSKRTSVGT